MIDARQLAASHDLAAHGAHLADRTLAVAGRELDCATATDDERDG